MLVRRSFLNGALAGAVVAQSGLAGRAVAAAPSALAVRDLPGGLDMITGAGTNVVVAKGADGAVVVDSGQAAHAGALLALISQRNGGARPRTLFNTCWRLDQTGGNDVFGAAGSRIVAQENTRLWMGMEFNVNWENKVYPPRAPVARPTEGFYTGGAMPVGDERIEYGHLQQPHTDGDTYVFFRKANVLAVGGAVASRGWPVIDWETGGWIGGHIWGLETLIKLADDRTMIIPADGPPLTKADLVKQRVMYITLYNKMAGMMGTGKGAAEVIASKPAAEYEAERGDSTQFTTLAFKSFWSNIRQVINTGGVRPLPLVLALMMLLGAALSAAPGPALAATSLAATSLAATSLAEAAQADDRPAALKLVSRATANEKSADGTPVLVWAAHNGDAALVKALLKAGADPKAVSTFGATAMREAANSGNVEAMRALLEAGADADSTTPDGLTNLMIVAKTDNVEAARLLLSRGAKVNAIENEENQTALMLAADQGHPAMVRLLLANGADPNLHAKSYDYDVRVSGEPRVRFDPTGGQTALIFAARAGCVDCAKALVEGGAKIDDRDPDQVTALITANLNANFDVAAYLVKAGADVNRWDWWGRTALWAAVDYNTLPRGGRSDKPTDDDTSALEMIKILLDAGANPNARIKFEVPMRWIESDRGGDPTQTTGQTALIRAAKGGDFEATELLLKAGARVDLAVQRQWQVRVGGMNALMIAAGLGQQINDTRGKLRTQERALATVKLLLAADPSVRPDINAQDERGATALMGAVHRGWNDVVQLLIENGADPYLPNNDRQTAMDAAQGKVKAVGLQHIDINPETAALIARLKPNTTASVTAAQRR